MAYTPGPRPCLQLQTLDRGDGLLGLRPCGPVKPPSRSPLFGARGPQVTVARLLWRRAAGTSTGPCTPTTEAQAAAHARLRASGLHPLPLDALQWRGELPALPADAAPWSLVRESDFPAWWAEHLPALQAEGWAIDQLPGFAHAALPVSGWQIALKPLTQPRGMGSWLLSLGVTLQTRDGSETLDLVPLLARLIRHDAAGRMPRPWPPSPTMR